MVGHGAEQIKAHFTDYQSAEGLKGDDLLFAEQEQQLGTGHAVSQAMSAIPARSVDDRVLVLYGDVPLVSKDTLIELIERAIDAPLGVLTLFTENPEGLGRIVRDDNFALEAIVEERDASEEQLGINEINSGILVASAIELKNWLGQLSDDNAQGEYYLTDIVGMAVADGHTVLFTESFMRKLFSLIILVWWPKHTYVTSIVNDFDIRIIRDFVEFMELFLG